MSPRRPSCRPALALALAALLAGLPLAGLAQPHRLDDSGTHTVPPHVQMHWREGRPAARDDGAMEASALVNVQLDMRRWRGRSGRVYLVLDRDSPSALEARWTSRGRLLPGRLSPGERAPVWAGRVTESTLTDQLHLRLRAAADWLADTRRLNFHFEFDAD